MKLIAVLLVGISLNVSAGEQEANYWSDRIQNYHSFYGLVTETQFASPTSEEVLWTNGAGDSAIWTGHYLAAEAFRYAVTRSPVALQFAKRTLNTIKHLSELSGTGLLARAFIPLSSPWFERYKEIEGGYGLHSGVVDGEDVLWQAHPTRDQYAGVFFGLAVAYDMIDDQEVKDLITQIVTRLMDHLIKNNWHIKKHGGGKIEETYLTMVHQQLSMLQVAKHVNPGKFTKAYKNHKRRWGWLMTFRFRGKDDEDKSYFRFNLNYTYFYNLIRLEADAKEAKGLRKVYNRFRKTTAHHLNAHFNMIDYAINGASEQRDNETRQSIDELWARGFRDHYKDLSGKYQACGDNRACDVIPVIDRVYADFLWQRSPFQLWNGGDGSVESPGVDYVLSYWMARHYGVLGAD